MAAKIGPSGLVFGATDESWAYVESISEKTSIETKEVTNGAGDITAANFHGKKKEITVTATWRSDTSNWKGVATGTACTLSDTRYSGNWYVTGVEDAVSGPGEARKQTFTAVQYPDLAT